MDGLLFEVSDVLYDARGWRRWLWHLLRRMDFEFDDFELWQIWKNEFFDAVCRGEEDFEHAFGKFLAFCGLPRRVIREVQAASRPLRRQLEMPVRPLFGVATTLCQLREMGLRLGVLTDTAETAEQVKRRLARLGLAGCFSVLLTSQDLAQTKPSPYAYHAALQSLGLAAERAGFVSPEPRELAGAARMGMVTIAFNHDRHAQADHYLCRFDELVPVIQQSRRNAIPHRLCA